MTDDTAKPVVTLNILRSTVIVLVPVLGDATVITTISKVVMTNTHIMRFKKGIGSINPPLNWGKNFNSTDKGMVANAAVNAAVEVAFFQNKPNKKIDSTPGDIKPTYSCIN